jgi:hypothetical protein
VTRTNMTYTLPTTPGHPHDILGRPLPRNPWHSLSRATVRGWAAREGSNACAANDQSRVEYWGGRVNTKARSSVPLTFFFLAGAVGLVPTVAATTLGGA